MRGIHGGVTARLRPFGVALTAADKPHVCQVGPGPDEALDLRRGAIRGVNPESQG
jgi:hypothetical protein